MGFRKSWGAMVMAAALAACGGEGASPDALLNQSAEHAQDGLYHMATVDQIPLGRQYIGFTIADHLLQVYCPEGATSERWLDGGTADLHGTRIRVVFAYTEWCTIDGVKRGRRRETVYEGTLQPWFPDPNDGPGDPFLPSGRAFRVVTAGGATLFHGAVQGRALHLAWSGAGYPNTFQYWR